MSERAYVCGEKRWQLWWHGKRLDLCFPCGFRDYPWYVELRYWLTPTVWFRRGGGGWNCYQLRIWRIYLRWWWGDYRWSAAEQTLVLIK